MKHFLLGTVLLLSGFGHAAAAKRVCAPADAAGRDVAATLEALYAAAGTDDLRGFHAVTTPDFYAYDGGQRFAGDALMTLIAEAHAAGKTFEWHVEAPRVHVACDSAWMTYVNRGAVQDASGQQEVTWLESAVLLYNAHRWQIQFLHATRTPTPLPP